MKVADKTRTSHALSSQDLEERWELLSLDAADLTRLAGFQKLARESARPVARHVAARYLANDSTRPLYERPQLEAIAVEAQERFFGSLPELSRSPEKIAERFSSIIAQERIGVPLPHVLSAYHTFVQHLAQQAHAEAGGASDELVADLATLMKVAFHDLGFAFDYYRKSQAELLERTTSLLNDILDDSTDDAVVLQDPSRRIVSWNEGARLLYGYAAKTVIGRPLDLLFPAGDRSGNLALDALVERAQVDRSATTECDQVDRHGQRFRAEVTLTLRLDTSGAALGWLYRARIAPKPMVGTETAPELSSVTAVRPPDEVRHDGEPTVETVLVVDDEDGVRRLIADVLTKLGYAVLVAASGRAAMELLADETIEPHLLLTDINMPVMSGRHLAAEVRRLRPATRILYLTGYSQEMAVLNGMLDPAADCLPKPFSLDQLASRVERALKRL